MTKGWQAWGVSLGFATAACGGARGEAGPGARAAPAMPGANGPTFENEVRYLEARGAHPVVLSRDGGGGRIAISAEYQARVMTSAVRAGGESLGFVHHRFIDAGKRGTPFDNYGGEDRFWLGPEGGQFGLYFPPGARFVFDAWQTPHELQEGAWQELPSAKPTPDTRVFARTMNVVSWSGARFSVAVERTIRLVDGARAADHLGVAPDGVEWVAFETSNVITNVGPEPWTKEKGLVSVWILGMYNPAPDMHVIVPFEREGGGPIVNDAYFGKVPTDRLAVHEREGFLTFLCDGHHRSKIGLGPARAKPALGSYSAAARLLTIVQLDRPDAARPYVNGMWEQQPDPFAGDAVNSYNDGPTEPGKPALGGFYELESSSPAAALAPKESLRHTQRTFHFVGEHAALDRIARRALGVSLDQL